MIFDDFDDENDLNDLDDLDDEDDDKVTGSARLVVTLKTVALWLHSSSSTVIPSVSSLSGFGSSGTFSLVNRSWEIQINRP